MTRRVAVTGGTGLLGRYLARELAAEGLEAVVLTRARDATPAPGTVTTTYEVPSLVGIFEEWGVDAVAHLAASRSSDRAVGAHISSLTSAQNTFEAAAKAGVRDIAFASTIGVYDRNSDLPWRENSPVAPRLTYGVMKYAAELLASQYPNVRIRSLRLGHLYGANEDNDYMINRFMRRARADASIEVNVAATAPRDFVYARDAARGVVQSLLSEVRGPFNIGSGTSRSTLEMARAVVEGFGSSSEIVEIHDGGALVEASGMDIDRARHAFGYGPRYGANEAFREIRGEMA